MDSAAFAGDRPPRRNGSVGSLYAMGNATRDAAALNRSPNPSFSSATGAPGAAVASNSAPGTPTKGHSPYKPRHKRFGSFLGLEYDADEPLIKGMPASSDNAAAMGGRDLFNGGADAAARLRAKAPEKEKDAEDEEDSRLDKLMERVGEARLVASSGRLIKRVMESTAVAILFDLLDVFLFVLDIYTDAYVCKALHDAGLHLYFVLTVFFLTHHYGIMAVLVTLYIRRSHGRLTWWGGEGDGEGSRSLAWLAFVPISLPAIVFMDCWMVINSILPLCFRKREGVAALSSMMSNYFFSRVFIEFVFESIPQTIVQTYIAFKIMGTAQTTAHDAIIVSLTVSSVNVCKYAWRLWKAASDAGMNIFEYFKYLLLLKGNYECAPAAMEACIQECCTLKEDSLLINGFQLHKSKSKYGPAQQAYILLNSFERFEGRPVMRLTVSGCPLPSMNRILQRGLKTFPKLTAIEVNECAFRGNNFGIVTKAIRKHGGLKEIRLVQTGVLKKYKNWHKAEVTRLFKSKLGLHKLALCVPWWDAAMMEAAAKHLADHTSLQTLALEYPVLRQQEAELEQLKYISRMASLGAQYGWAVASVLAVNTSLTSLYLHNHSLHEESVVLIAKALASNTCVKQLSLKGSQIGDQGAIALSRALRLNCSLLTLNLRSASLHAEGVSALAMALVDNRTLTALDLSHNRIHHAAVKELGRALRLNSALSSLRLEGWQDTFESEEATGVLTASLAVNKGLKELSLAGSVVGDAGAKLLASALSSNSALRSLDLSGNEQAADDTRIGDTGAAALFSALAQNRSLTSLNLKVNRLGTAAAEAAAATLRLNGTLRALDLTACELKDGAVSAIMAALAANTALTSLGMAKVTAVDMEGARYVRDALQRNATLTSLDLSFAGVPPAVDVADALWSVIAQGLAVNRGLKTLNLSHAGVTDGGAAALAAALAGNRTLTQLDIAGLSSARCREAFGGALEGNLALKTLNATGEDYALENVLPIVQTGSRHGSKLDGSHSGLRTGSKLAEFARPDLAKVSGGGQHRLSRPSSGSNLSDTEKIRLLNA